MPRPKRPVLVRMSGVVVAPATVDEDTRKRFVLVSAPLACIDSFAQGVVLPMPIILLTESMNIVLPSNWALPLVYMLKPDAPPALNPPLNVEVEFVPETLMKPMNVEVAVVEVANRVPTVSVLEVETILVPSYQRRLSGMKDVEPVPPFEVVRVPVIVESVVEATHCIPEPVDWRYWPAVPGRLAPAKSAPVRVRAVEEAYGKDEAVVDVAVKEPARALVPRSEDP